MSMPAYVTLVLLVVEDKCEKETHSRRLVGEFWNWLGNRKFTEDNSYLSPERAEFVRLNLDMLWSEFQASIAFSVEERKSNGNV